MGRNRTGVKEKYHLASRGPIVGGIESVGLDHGVDAIYWRKKVFYLRN